MIFLNFKRFLVEKIINKEPKIDISNYLESIGKKDTDKIDEIHQHPDIKPQNITDNHKNALDGYSKHSYLFNKFLQRTASTKNFDNNPEITDKYKNNIKKLSDVFTKENTNKKPIISYSGIAPHIGKKLLNFENNSKHTFPCFISTSTEKPVALHFTTRRARRSNQSELHLIKAYNEPHSTVSMVKHSIAPYENELLLNHGTHGTYLGTTKEEHNNMPTYIHHIIMHNTRTPLEDYVK